MCNEVLFSLIIPVFNKPEYSVRKLFESINNQITTNYEVIVVDDGSNIECGFYIKKLTDKYGYKYFWQENNGVSSARNRGIVEAIGTYIIFADADDILSECYLDEAQKYVNKYNPDVIIGNLQYSKVVDDRLVKLTPELCSKGDLVLLINSLQQNFTNVYTFYDDDIIEVKKCLIGAQPRKNRFRILGSPCAAVYKTDIIKKTLFKVGVKICEDQLFNREVLQYAKSVLAVPNIWYYYIQYPESSIHTFFNEYKFETMKKYWDELLLVNNKEDKDLINNLYIYNISLCFTEVKNAINSINNYLLSKPIIEEIISHPLMKDTLENIQIHRSDFNNYLKYYLLKHRLTIPLYTLCRMKK